MKEASMNPSDVSLGRFFLRTTCCHVPTYFVAGLAAYTLMDYRTQFQSESLSCLMLPTDSRWVALGPALQFIRGLVFALALYPFRRVFLDEDRGWLKLWGLFLGLTILSTAGAAPGSIEAMIYTKLPVVGQILGLWETLLQTLALSVLLVSWHRRPHRAWGIVLGISTGLVVLMSIAGAVLPRPESFR
jgi:hypothetical protein